MKPEIKNLKEYGEALLKLEKLFDAMPNTEEGDDLDKLVKLIEDWEDKEFPIK